MPTDFDDKEPSVVSEPVERRDAPRGLVRDVAVTLPDGRRVPTVEASRKGVFAAVDDPDAWPLGTLLDIGIERGDRRVACRAEVVRKELEPRRGVALRIAHIAPADEERLRDLLE